MNKSLLTLAIASTLGASVSVNAATTEPSRKLIISVPLIAEKLSTWSDAPTIYHPWTNVGGHYNCKAWTPDTDTYDFGVAFTQERSCNQNQERDAEIRKKDSFSGIVKTVQVIKQNRIINETEQQPAVGTYRNWVAHSSTFTAWTDVGSDYDHSAWTPAAANQVADFTQARNFKHNQERFEQERERDTVTGDIRDKGVPIKRTQIDGRNESRSVDVNVTAWVDSGGHYDCLAWTPTPDTVDVHQTFTQSRDCSQDQTRRWSYDASGSEIHSRNEAQTITEVETQQEVGTKRNWIAHASTFTPWVDEGVHHTFGAWSPTPDAQTSNFVQSRSVKQDQTRQEQEREIDTISGEIRNSGAPIKRDQTINESESRTVAVSWSTWLNTTKDTYTAWSPAPTTQTANFTQTRTFSQNQTRNRVYKVGATTLKTVAESRTLSSQSESRTVAVSWSTWVDSGSHYSCGAWSPEANTVGYGVDFTQTRSCSQNQVRNRIYKVGSTTINTESESRTISENETRTVPGEGFWVTHTSTFTSWINDGGRHTYSAWSPSSGSQTLSYSQSRTYKQDQTRNEQRRERDTISGAIRNVGSPIARSQTINGSESRSVTVSVSSWSNTSTSSHSAWSPAASSQTSTFSQSRSYTQNQSRNWTHKVGSTTVHTRNETRALTGQSQSRNVTVSWSSWAFSSNHSYGTYSPATNTVCSGDTFTQSRSYKRQETRNRTYSEGSSFVETRDLNRTQSRSATGTKVCEDWVPASSTYTSWKWDGADYAWTAWSPSPGSQTSNYTQTRSYKRDQIRYRQAREYDNVSGTYRNVGSAVPEHRTITTNQSRSITVTWSGWSNSGGAYSCGTYGPDPSTVNLDQSFTQTRTCKQNRVGGYTHKSGSTTIYTNNRSTTIDITQSRNAVGTKDYIVDPDYREYYSVYTSWSCGSWSPSASNYYTDQTVNQSRTCTRDKQDWYRRYQVWKSGTKERLAVAHYKTTTESNTENQSVPGTKTRLSWKHSYMIRVDGRPIRFVREEPGSVSLGASCSSSGATATYKIEVWSTESCDGDPDRDGRCQQGYEDEVYVAVCSN